jgi:predicted transcriptional regulator
MIGKSEIVLLNVVGRINAAKKYYALYSIYFRMEFSEDIDIILRNLISEGYIGKLNNGAEEEYMVTDKGGEFLKDKLISRKNKEEYDDTVSNIDFFLKIVE